MIGVGGGAGRRTAAGPGGGGGGDGTEPADPGSGYRWSDDFDRYASAPAMFAAGGCGAGTDAFGLPDASATYSTRTEPNTNDGCNSNNDNMSLVSPGRGGAGKALRSSIQNLYPSQQSLTWLTPWPQNSLGSSLGTSSIVIQFYFRVSSSGTPGSLGMKWNELFWSHATQRIQWGVDLGTDARPLWTIALGANPGHAINRTHQSTAPYWDSLNDAAWHRCTNLVKPNATSTYSNTTGTSSDDETYTGTSSRDGRAAVWIDGTKIMDYSQSTVDVATTGGGVWCRQGDVDMIPAMGSSTLQYITLCDVVNGSPDAWTLDHDDLKVWVF